MSILVNKDTKVIMQGITGAFGTYHSGLMLEYGTSIVAGVTPGRGGSEVNGVPVYNSVKEAVQHHHVDATITMVPAPFIKDSIFEAIDAGIGFIACLVEGVPVQDMMIVKKRLQETGTLMIGPNSPGLVTPGETLLGFMPGYIYKPGRVGMVSRSGTFSYQVAYSMSKAGIGQSTCVGIGGDPITGVSFVEVLERFEQDPDTDVIVLVGEIGRTSEEEAAEYIRNDVSKPVVALILGSTAPPGKQMGHAGAIITAGRGTYASKVRALEAAGVPVARTAGEVASLVQEVIAEKGDKK
ncbi:MAG: succinate--CoA ligase subunit alpha [Bacillota bacterium]